MAQTTSSSCQVQSNFCTNAWKSKPQNTWLIPSHKRISVNIPFERIKFLSNVFDFQNCSAIQKKEYF